jgi:hypothetical protein
MMGQKEEYGDIWIDYNGRDAYENPAIH